MFTHTINHALMKGQLHLETKRIMRNYNHYSNIENVPVGEKGCLGTGDGKQICTFPSMKYNVVAFL